MLQNIVGGLLAVYILSNTNCSCSVLRRTCFLEMETPTKEDLFDGNILEVLTLASIQSLLQNRKFLHVASFYHDKEFTHKNKN